MSEAAHRLWSWIYGATLVAIGIGCALFVVHEIMNPLTHEPLALLIYRLAALSFISLGAIVIGVERILRREVQALQPAVKPDEWLVAKFGPKGSFWHAGNNPDKNADKRSECR